MDLDWHAACIPLSRKVTLSHEVITLIDVIAFDICELRTAGRAARSGSPPKFSGFLRAVICGMWFACSCHMGWAQRGRWIAEQINMTRAFTVPEQFVPRLLELWDTSGKLAPHPSNKPLTEHGRMMWTAREFCREHRGEMFGQASVFIDLCAYLEDARKIASRLKV